MKRLLNTALSLIAAFGVCSTGAFAQSHTDHATTPHATHLLDQLWTCNPSHDGVCDASWVTVDHTLAAKLTTDNDGQGFDVVNAGVYIEQGLPIVVGKSLGAVSFDCKFIADNSGEDPDCYHGPFLIFSGIQSGSKFAVVLGPDQSTVTGPNAQGWFHVVHNFDNPFQLNSLGVATTHHTVSVLIANLKVLGIAATPDTHHHAANCVFGNNLCNDFVVVDYCGPDNCHR